MGEPTLLYCGAVCGEGSKRKQCHFLTWSTLSPLSVTSLPSYTGIFPFQVLIPQVGELVYVLRRSCGPLQWTLLWDWKFLPLPQPPQIFTARGFEALFPCTGTLCCVAQSVTLPSCSSCLICSGRGDIPSTSHHLATCPLCPGCSSLPVFPVWMNVSSLTPWLLDFHAVWFSGSSGCFWFLNWWLSFFWFSEEVKCFYLCLHLGQNSTTILPSCF